jgi:HEAT repeat protein
MSLFRAGALMISLLLAASSLAATPGAAMPALPAPSTFRLQIDGSLMSLEAKGAPLSEILAAVGDLSGMDVVIEGELHGEVHDAFADLPLQRALKRLIGDLPHVMLHDPGAGTPRELWIYGTARQQGSARTEAGTHQARAKVPDRPRLDTARQLNALMRKERRAAREMARAALARDTADLSPLGADLAAEDPNTRRRAIQALAQIGDGRAAEMLAGALQVEREPGLRRLALAALSRIDGPGARFLLEAAPARLGAKEKAPWGPGGSSNR